LNDEFNPFVLPTSGTPGGVRLVKVSSAMDLDAVQIAFTSNSARVFIRGDLVAPNDTSLWSTDDFVTADQTASALLVQGVPASGDINGFAIAP
ncbi:MAG TPA: hypothetical protein VFB62_25165, partial [Polyangiaceae bacterium]|nr:hypothetical protein [Polyangiaceae bacterium]